MIKSLHWFYHSVLIKSVLFHHELVNFSLCCAIDQPVVALHCRNRQGDGIVPVLLKLGS